jgi:predicted kinase
MGGGHNQQVATFFLMVGLPGAGKTARAKELAAQRGALRLGTSVILDFGFWARDERSAPAIAHRRLMRPRAGLSAYPPFPAGQPR